MGAGSTATLSTTSSSRWTGVELPIPMEATTGRTAEVFAWVDANGEGLPILKCSSGFSLLSGPSPLGTQLCSMIENAPDFLAWFQHKLNTYFVGDAVDPDEWVKSMRPEAVCQIILHHVGTSASNLLELRADCSLDVARTMLGPEDCDLDDYDEDIWFSLQMGSDAKMPY